MHENRNLQERRKEYIRCLAKNQNATLKAKNIADDLFALDLTVYSLDYSLESLIYNAMATSELDENISLHPEQINIVNKIRQQDALIVSAPTSFGKTFCIFEYIAKNKPQNIVLIVPTLALVDEYYKKIIKRYKEMFSEYKVHTSVSEDKEYDFKKKTFLYLPMIELFKNQF
jgi:replicative superfamily II helicase